MLKIEIWPAFLNKSHVEIKPEGVGYRLWMTKDAVPELDDPGKIWIENIPSTADAERLLGMVQDIIAAPTPDHRILLDGVSVKMKLGEQSIQFRSPEEGTPEQAFVAQLFALVRQAISDLDCIDYLELLGEYFFEEPPMKVFPGPPYRLKLFGRVTTQYSDQFVEEIHRLKDQPAAILDMSNFSNIGRALDGELQSLIGLEQIAVYANRWARNYLVEIGFDEGKIRLGRP